MRIAYIANIRFPTEKAHGIQIAKACEALTKAGEEVTLAVPTRRTPIKAPAMAFYGVKQSFLVRKLFAFDLVHFGKLGFWVESFSFALSALMYLRKHAFEAVYGRDELVLSVLISFGIRNVFWESHDGTWNIFSRYVAKHAAGIIVVSGGLKRFYIDHGVSEAKLHATPNGIDTADFAQVQTKEEARARLELPQDKKIVLYIGRLDGWKGTDTLLAASALLPDSVEVVLVGGEAKQIDALSKRYPKVRFLGYRPYSELPNNQAAADVLVVPNTAKNDVSVRFTSPLKLIAHLAARRPIVASDLPSIRELVGDNSAVLVAPDDPQALAKGIQEALARPELGERAANLAAAFDWQVRARGIIDFMRDKLMF